jgi:hypothetical protein
MSAWAGRDRKWEVDDPGRGSLLAGVERRPTGRSFGCLPSWSRTTSAYSFTGGATSPHNVSVPTHGGRLWYAVMTTYPQMRATAKVSRGGWRTEATARTPRMLRSQGQCVWGIGTLLLCRTTMPDPCAQMAVDLGTALVEIAPGKSGGSA